MPHKYNADRRHHIPRPKRRVTNWSAYNEALHQRGSLTVLVHGGCDCRLESGTAHDAGWPAALLRPRNHDSFDVARGVPPGAAPDRGADRLGPPAASCRSAGTRFLDPQLARPEPGTAGAAPRDWRTDPPAG